MSPILTRPVREQLEHDRVIRLLQARYKRKHDVVMNPGAEQNQSVTVGALSVFPDLLLLSENGKRLEGTVEVETGESVNQLEAMAEWGTFSKLKVPLHLYVPPSSVDTTRRLCTELQIPVAEIWTFHLQFDQARFTMVYRAPDAAIPKAKSSAASEKTAKPKAPASAKASASARATADRTAGKAPKAAAKAAPKAKPAKAKPAGKAKAPTSAKASAGKPKKSAKPGKRR